MKIKLLPNKIFSNTLNGSIGTFTGDLSFTGRGSSVIVYCCSFFHSLIHSFSLFLPIIINVNGRNNANQETIRSALTFAIKFNKQKPQFDCETSKNPSNN